MSHLNGFEVAKQLHAEYGTLMPKIIYITADTTQKTDEDWRLHHGMVKIHKPTNRNILLKGIIQSLTN